MNDNKKPYDAFQGEEATPANGTQRLASNEQPPNYVAIPLDLRMTNFIWEFELYEFYLKIANFFTIQFKFV